MSDFEDKADAVSFAHLVPLEPARVAPDSTVDEDK